MSNHKIKDKKRRDLINKYEFIRKELKSVFYNLLLPDSVRMEAFSKLQELPRNSSVTRLRNRCVLTGRSRGVYKKFKISRISLRELASNGLITGIRKSSW